MLAWELIFSHVTAVWHADIHICKEYLNFRHNRLPALEYYYFLCTRTVEGPGWRLRRNEMTILPLVMCQPSNHRSCCHCWYFMNIISFLGHWNVLMTRVTKIICRYVAISRCPLLLSLMKKQALVSCTGIEIKCLYQCHSLWKLTLSTHFRSQWDYLCEDWNFRSWLCRRDINKMDPFQITLIKFFLGLPDESPIWKMRKNN